MIAKSIKRIAIKSSLRDTCQSFCFSLTRSLTHSLEQPSKSSIHEIHNFIVTSRTYIKAGREALHEQASKQASNSFPLPLHGDSPPISLLCRRCTRFDITNTHTQGTSSAHPQSSTQRTRSGLDVK